MSTECIHLVLVVYIQHLRDGQKCVKEIAKSDIIYGYLFSNLMKWWRFQEDLQKCPQNCFQSSSGDGCDS